MKRDVDGLATNALDLLIIGGGAYGVCAAWEAAQRGLTVALIERGDFGEATSSNSLHTMHGGLRYLQHLDLRRMRDSIPSRRSVRFDTPAAVPDSRRQSGRSGGPSAA